MVHKNIGKIIWLVGIMVIVGVAGCANDAVFVKCTDYFIKNPVYDGNKVVNTAQEAHNVLKEYEPESTITSDDLTFVEIKLDTEDTLLAWVVEGGVAIDENGKIYQRGQCL
jgi:hypothetical protein